MELGLCGSRRVCESGIYATICSVFCEWLLGIRFSGATAKLGCRCAQSGRERNLPRVCYEYSRADRVRGR